MQSASSQFADLTTNMEIDASMQPSVPAPNSALDAIDEMSDKEQGRFNLVIYNFSEEADQKVDTKSFQTLCMHVFKLDYCIVKSVRLGPKTSNIHRPLLLTVEEFDDSNYLISHSHRHDQYKNIFIAPDRTKLEHLKNKKAVNELRERRAKGDRVC